MTETPQNLNSKDATLLVNTIASYLAAQGVGTVGTDLFKMVLPENPSAGTVVVPTGGIDLPEDPTRRPSFQVMHRNPNTELGLSKSVEINRLLDNQWNVLSGFPGRITAVSEPGAYFKDDNGRPNFPLNYVLVTTFQR